MSDYLKLAGDIIHWLGAVAGLGTLAYSIINMLIAQKAATGLHTGAALKVLRTPYLVIATILFFWLGYALWKPLPIQFSAVIELSLAMAGLILLLPNLALYIWGLKSLGANFNASSGFGVRLTIKHELVTRGPFAYLRHPMYLGVILAFWGGLLLFHTWTMLIFAVMMFGLIARGNKEEEALAQAFGASWEAYRREVPGWLPRMNMHWQKKDIH